MRSTADRLFGRENYQFSVLGAGRHQMSLVTMGAIMGGNVRVGLEDSVYLSRGVKARSNAEQVRKIRRMLEELSFEIATPADARAHARIERARERLASNALSMKQMALRAKGAQAEIFYPAAPVGNRPARNTEKQAGQFPETSWLQLLLTPPAATRTGERRARRWSSCFR